MREVGSHLGVKPDAPNPLILWRWRVHRMEKYEPNLAGAYILHSYIPENVVVFCSWIAPARCNPPLISVRVVVCIKVLNLMHLHPLKYWAGPICGTDSLQGPKPWGHGSILFGANSLANILINPFSPF